MDAKQPSSTSMFFTQLKAMLKRNVLLKQRQKRKTTAVSLCETKQKKKITPPKRAIFSFLLQEVLLPLYSLAVLIIIKIAMPNPNFPVIDTPRREASKLFEYFQTIDNHTVAVVPNTTDTQEFLRNMNELWQSLPLQQNPPTGGIVHPIDFLVFDTIEDLLKAYWKDPMQFPIAVIFEPPGPIVGPLKYEIRPNPSFFETPPTGELFSSPASCRELAKPWSNMVPIEIGESCPVNQYYYYSGFVALQALLDYTKIRVSIGGRKNT